jgi:hypothetical protein
MQQVHSGDAVQRRLFCEGVRQGAWHLSSQHLLPRGSDLCGRFKGSLFAHLQQEWSVDCGGEISAGSRTARYIGFADDGDLFVINADTLERWTQQSRSC